MNRSARPASPASMICGLLAAAAFSAIMAPQARAAEMVATFTGQVTGGYDLRNVLGLGTFFGLAGPAALVVNYDTSRGFETADPGETLVGGPGTLFSTYQVPTTRGVFTFGGHTFTFLPDFQGVASSRPGAGLDFSGEDDYIAQGFFSDTDGFGVSISPFAASGDLDDAVPFQSVTGVGGIRLSDFYAGSIYTVLEIGFSVQTVEITRSVAPPSPPVAIPEPSTWALLISGFAAVGALLRRRRDPSSTFGRVPA